MIYLDWWHHFPYLPDMQNGFKMRSQKSFPLVFQTRLVPENRCGTFCISLGLEASDDDERKFQAWAGWSQGGK